MVPFEAKNIFHLRISRSKTRWNLGLLVLSASESRHIEMNVCYFSCSVKRRSLMYTDTVDHTYINSHKEDKLFLHS